MNFKYVGVFNYKANNELVIDSKNIIKGESFNSGDAKDILKSGNNEPWREVPPSSRPYAVKVLCKKEGYAYIIAIDPDARLTRNDAVEFTNAVYQGMEPLLGGNVSKQFEPQFKNLISENNYIVTIDKVKVAQKKADEVKTIMRDNVQQLSANTKLLDEETVPGVQDIAQTAYEIQEQAVEVKEQEVKKGRQLNLIIFLIIAGIIAIVVLFIFL